MVEKGRILVVDDEPAIRFFLNEELAQAGYTVFTAASGEEVLAFLETEPVDLILLDLKMEGLDGIQVMKEVAREKPSPVVIILTAYASLESAIETLRHGGHDYLLKPCRTEELLTSVEKGLTQHREELRRQKLARLIEESARQLQNAPSPVVTTSVVRDEEESEKPSARPRFLQARGLLLDREQHTVVRQGQPLHLTPTEFRLLACLMERANELVTFRRLAEELHGRASEEWEARQTLSTHLWRLRRKVGIGPDEKPYIVNVRGRGYKFVGKEG